MEGRATLHSADMRKRRPQGQAAGKKWQKKNHLMVASCSSAISTNIDAIFVGDLVLTRTLGSPGPGSCS